MSWCRGGTGRSEPSQLSDRDLVESVLRDLSEAADKWEALVTQAETVTYSGDLGDVRAVANLGRAVARAALHPGVITATRTGSCRPSEPGDYALRDEVEAENRARYGGPPAVTSVSARIKPICCKAFRRRGAQGPQPGRGHPESRYPSLAPGWHPDPEAAMRI
ncbi:DUF2710 domain-containing protein, partial [Mycobacterium tuberculosis variant bovis]